MTVTEIMTMFVNKRKARAEELRDELIDLHRCVSSIEETYGSDMESYPEPIQIEYNSYVIRAREIRDEMIELRKEKELDNLYANIEQEINELIQ